MPVTTRSLFTLAQFKTQNRFRNCWDMVVLVASWLTSYFPTLPICKWPKVRDLPWPLTIWSLLDSGTRLALMQYILTSSDWYYGRQCPAKVGSTRVHDAGTLVLRIWPDPDTARDLKIHMLSTHQKCFVTYFRLPPRIFWCGYCMVREVSAGGV